MWKPAVHSVKSPHRKLALALINFKIGDEDIARYAVEQYIFVMEVDMNGVGRRLNRWEKEGKQAQAACWLLFTIKGLEQSMSLCEVKVRVLGFSVQSQSHRLLKLSRIK